MNEIIYVRFIVSAMTITPGVFEYYTPSTIVEAINLLEEYGDEAKVLAGGQSLIPLMKLRFAEISHIVDISRIEEMDYVREDENLLRIGALTTVAELASSTTINKRYPLIKEAAEQIADPQVRNMGTVGGNISHGDPANDLPSVMLALNATFMVQGKSGNREIKSEDFFLDSLTTALKPGEVLYEIRIPTPVKREGGAYIKHKKVSGDFSVAAVASRMVLDEGGKITDVSVALTAVGPTAIKSGRVSALLSGRKLSEDLAADVAKEIAEESDPVVDLYGTTEYKKKVLRFVVKEALMAAYRRAKEGE